VARGQPDARGILGRTSRISVLSRGSASGDYDNIFLLRPLFLLNIRLLGHCWAEVVNPLLAACEAFAKISRIQNMQGHSSSSNFRK
jgi:hypothetical protein